MRKYNIQGTMEDLKNKPLTPGQFITKNSCYIGLVISVIACAITLVLTFFHFRIAARVYKAAESNTSDRLWGAIYDLRSKGAGDIHITYDKVTVYDKEGKITQVLHSPIPVVAKEK